MSVDNRFLRLILMVIAIFQINVAAIQNTPTNSKLFDDDIILSASSFVHDKTLLSSSSLSRSKNDNSEGSTTSPIEATELALQLESSRSAFQDSILDRNNDNVADSIYKVMSHDDDASPGAIITAALKNIEHIDGNNIEMKSAAEYYENIPSTKDLSGEDQGVPLPLRQHILSTTATAAEPHHRQMAGSFQQRQGRQDLQQIYDNSERTLSSNMQTVAAEKNNKRQANSDIHDIITGIVKLLNGNVNVAANTIRPHKPIQTTRINNRGPPRISDLPPLPPDFDTPGMNPPPLPSSTEELYPFEKPPTPERPSVNQLPPVQERPNNNDNNNNDNNTPVRPLMNGILVPESTSSPGNRPWNRLQHRPNNNRRPITPYKPLLLHQDHTYLHGDDDTSLTNNSNDDKQSHIKMVSQRPLSEILDEIGVKKPQKYQPPSLTLKQNKTIADSNTLILGSNPQPIPIPNYQGNILPSSLSPQSAIITLESDSVNKLNPEIHESHINNKPNIFNEETTIKTPTTSSVSSSSFITHRNATTTTLKIETISSIQVIEPTRTTIEMQPSTHVLLINRNSDVTSSIANDTQTRILDSSRVTEEMNSSYNENYHHHLSTPTDGLKTKLPSQTSSSSNSVIENTLKAVATPIHRPTSMMTFYKTFVNANYPYRPRPGIVLDDTLDYTGVQLATQRPYAPPKHPQIDADIFDVTVSAIQGSNAGSSGENLRIPLNPLIATDQITPSIAGSDIILTSSVEGQGFVSIDGKRTYLNLFDNTDENIEGGGVTKKIQIQPTRTHVPPQIIGTGYAVPQTETTIGIVSSLQPNISPSRRPIINVHRSRPTQPPIQIDTCIVGDTRTCDASQHEACATIQRVSACHCKPGYARLVHSLPCKRIISILVSIRVDRIYEWKIIWNQDFSDKDSESYQTIAFESNRAIESAMSMTPFSDEYMGSSINNIYQGDISKGQGGVFVNATLKLTYESRTSRPTLAGELQRHLLGVIHRRNNNIGNSAVYVDTPVGSISSLHDLDECASSELNDCNSSAVCTNNWGGFTCTCNSGLKDPHKDDANESGRSCISCPSSHCNNRGTCSYQGNIMYCSCTGNYYGNQCELDGEVLGVAIGATVAALIIIILTLVFLVMWSRRWSREQKAAGSPVYGYMQGGIPGTLPGTLARVGSIGTLASMKQTMPTNLPPPYLWGHIADRMAQANLYATKPSMGGGGGGMVPTRPSSAVFEYPTMSCHGTLPLPPPPPVPLPRLQAPSRPRQRHQKQQQQQRRQQQEMDSSDSELQDKDRADLIPQNSAGGFHVPRPKSRSSLANQSGIYYDVEYDQGDAQHLSKNNIPLSTYSLAARPYYRT